MTAQPTDVASRASIRPLVSADAPAYHALRLRMLRDFPDAFTSSFEEDATRPLAWVEARLAPPNRGGDVVVLGAFAEDGALLGCVGLNRETRQKQRHMALLFGMFVAPEHAGAGIGRALVDACIARAREMPGLEQVGLTVTATNERARRMYEMAGFMQFGFEERALKIGGVYHPKAHMVLYLDGTPAAATREPLATRTS